MGTPLVTPTALLKSMFRKWTTVLIAHAVRHGHSVHNLRGTFAQCALGLQCVSCRACGVCTALRIKPFNQTEHTSNVSGLP
jgi:hypothetical protein